MKHLRGIMLLAGCCLLASCNNQVENDNADKWEYKTSRVEGRKLWDGGDSPKYFAPEELEDSLNANGKEGWELVEVITETETIFPQFSEDIDNKSAIKPNTRTSYIRLIFKRKVR